MQKQEMNYDYRIPYEKVEGAVDLAKQCNELERQLQMARNKLIDLIKKSPEYEAVNCLISSTVYNGAKCTLSLDHSAAKASITLTFRGAPVKPDHLTYLDPKTLNQLLASKLLTDEEKREMLAHHVGGFFKTLKDEKDSIDEPVENDLEGDS